ncbi:MAG TPA: cytochrome P450 [Myxococcota bacterium]|nr:cytochrome P450 [Myxococcota bacterium]
MAMDYDPFAEAVRNDPHPWYRRLRDEAPAYFMERYDGWALSRFQDIWDASADTENYSTLRGTTPAQLLIRDQPVAPMINLMDPPEHTKLRAALRGAFLPNPVRAIEPAARKLAVELLDAARDRGEFDAVAGFGARISVTVTCLAIGLPVEDGPMLTGLVQRFFHHDPDSGGIAPEGLSALQELGVYCGDMVRARRRAPRDTNSALDVIVRYEQGGRRFDDEEAASHVSMLVIGGSETLPKVLANGLVRLAEYPEQRARIARDPSLVPDAFDEICRYDMPTQLLGRTVRRDVRLHGQTLRAGQPVMFLYASANHDPREFSDPDRFDIGRRPPRILTFGAGAHQCLGRHVARMEGRICLEEILARFPRYEVDQGRAVRLHTEFVQGFASLPVRTGG